MKSTVHFSDLVSHTETTNNT